MNLTVLNFDSLMTRIKMQSDTEVAMQKNKSRLKNFVFQHPEEPEPAASTTKRTFQAISKDIHPEILNSELSFRRNHGDFTSYLEAQIRLEGLNVTK
mmetsp:Transcript_11847/g.19137  ORF Transcript_11847/g.19137 Transcript_11847/m.19137 type:complete len:97 (-) Transcript_11847:16-306(-)